MLLYELDRREDHSERAGDTEIKRVEKLNSDALALKRANLVALPAGKTNDGRECDVGQRI